MVQASSTGSVQNSFAVDIRNGEFTDQSLLSVHVTGATSRLPVVMSWKGVNRCHCEFVPVEPGRHTVCTRSFHGVSFVTVYVRACVLVFIIISTGFLSRIMTE